MVFVGVSMEPTYMTGSIALTTQDFGKLHRGDIAVLNVSGEKIVKRVAYLPGDTVYQVKVGEKWLDGTDYRLPSYARRHPDKVRKVEVPPGCLYVLGDNAIESVDSRQFGFLRFDQVDRIVVFPRDRVVLPNSRERCQATFAKRIS
jgi:signal peptidase I